MYFSADDFTAPVRAVDKPLRFSISDVYKSVTGGLCAAGTLKAGALTPSTKVIVQPQGENANVKALSADEISVLCALAGDTVTCILSGIEINNLGVGK